MSRSTVAGPARHVSGRGRPGRPLLMLLLLGLGACASSADPDVVYGGTRAPLDFNRGRAATVGDDAVFAAPTTIAAPVEEVWKALLTAMTAVGVPLEAISEPSWTAGTQATTVRGRFAGRPVSTYLSCGGTAGVAEVADAHAVTLSVLSTLKPVSAGTELQTRVVGSAKDPFTSVPPRHCVSRHRIEAQIDSAVRALLPPS